MSIFMKCQKRILIKKPPNPKHQNLSHNPMKNASYLFALLFTTTVFGQTKDKRAALYVQGRVDEISVSPDEKIWLVTAMGNTYYTNNIDSNWHYGKPVFESTEELDPNHPNLDRISFFNKDTAIMTGYITVEKKGYTKNGFYLTQDGGANWKLLNYGGNSWIYTAYTDKQGNAWMGGESKAIYYSGDFGQHWKTLKLPFKKSDRIYGIYMIDSMRGVVSSDENEILITTNNWKTAKKISPPPYSKNYQKNIPGYNDERIPKIKIWDHYLVITRHRHVYYTDLDTINWKSLPISAYDFEIDYDANILYAITDSLKVVRFTSPTEYQLFTDKPLPGNPIDFKVVHGSLFAVSNGYQVYKVNKNALTNSLQYTTDKKIETPQIIKQGSALTWGATGNQLYVADDHQRDWYRAQALDFYVKDIMLLNDSVVILWDGIKDNYRYALNDAAPQQYILETPLETFLSSKIKKVLINSRTSGCFYGSNDEIHYKSINDTTLETIMVTKDVNREIEPQSFRNRISISALTALLKDINDHPAAVPSIQDFRITDTDKKNYLTEVDIQFHKKEAEFIEEQKKSRKPLDDAIPSKLDTLSSSVLEAILNQQEGGRSTSKNWFAIQIINQNNDTINIERFYYVKTLPWQLPWKFEYKGQHFNCYSIAFSRFIKTCISDDFKDKSVFDNRLLLIEISNYLRKSP